MRILWKLCHRYKGRRTDRVGFVRPSGKARAPKNNYFDWIITSVQHTSLYASLTVSKPFPDLLCVKKITGTFFFSTKLNESPVTTFYPLSYRFKRLNIFLHGYNQCKLKRTRGFETLFRV